MVDGIISAVDGLRSPRNGGGGALFSEVASLQEHAQKLGKLSIPLGILRESIKVWVSEHVPGAKRPNPKAGLQNFPRPAGDKNYFWSQNGL